MSVQKPDLPTADSDGGRDEAMYRGLHAAIYELRLPPGTRLPEDVLSNTYGVSRTLVRQALNQLSRDRLVTLSPARGAFVATPSVEEARQVFEVRAMLEGAMARALAARLTDAQLRDLIKCRAPNRQYTDDELAYTRCCTGCWRQASRMWVMPSRLDCA